MKKNKYIDLIIIGFRYLDKFISGFLSKSILRLSFIILVAFNLTFTACMAQQSISLSTSELGVFPTEHPSEIHGISDIQFRVHLIDDNFPGGAISQTALCDFTGDGELEYHVGGTAGNFIYQYNDGDWTRHEIRRIEPDGSVEEGRAPTDAAGTAADVTGNGLCDLIIGEAWYENPGSLEGDWQKYLYSESAGGNPGVHDQEMFDITGDGRLDMISMNDGTNLRWYEIPKDPREQWERHDIGRSIHNGISPKGFGDLNGNGFIDIVRGDIWFENSRGDGSWWREHTLGSLMTLPPGKLDDSGWANGARVWVTDVNGNGLNDVIQVDGELRGARVWWMENLGEEPDGTVRWRRHVIAGGLRNLVNEESVYIGRVMGGLHSLFVDDFTGNGRPDIVTMEQDWQRARPGPNGEEQPRAFLYENLGVGFDGTVLWHEHVIADVNLGGHEIVGGDVTGNGKTDIVAKPWSTSDNNALGGNAFIIFLENISP
jgi:hypothetical protein